MRSIKIDYGLELNGTGRGPIFLVETEGFDDPDRRVVAEERAGEDGGTYGPALLGMRPLTLTGLIKADDTTQYLAARRALVQAASIRRDSRGVAVPTGFVAVTDDGSTVRFSGVIRAFKAPETSKVSCDYFLTVICADPLLYGSTRATTGLMTPPSGGGTLVPATLPVTLGASSGGAGSAYNAGETDTPAYLTYTGALTNPYLYSVVRDVVFQLNLTTGPSDVIIVDMRDKVVLLNGTSAMSAKSTDSEWFSLAPGMNPFRFSSGSTADTGTLEVSGYDAYTSV